MSLLSIITIENIRSAAKAGMVQSISDFDKNIRFARIIVRCDKLLAR